jgi:serine protein kinase
MEALRDRTIKIDVPYITKLGEEIKIYEKEFNSVRIRGKHIAPHTLEMAAMWAVLTRLEEPKKHNLSVIQKLKLYNGKTLPNFTEDNIKELRKESLREGLEGISPRYIQDKISNALVSDKSESSINPFMVLNELETGLKQHSLIASEELRKKYRELLNVVKQEYEDIVKNEVQRAISADEEAIAKLCSNYIDNVKAYTQKEKIKNKYTGLYEEPDERLMKPIEEKIDIPDSRKDDFRREIMNYIGALAIDGKVFNWRTNERLQKALELKLFEAGLDFAWVPAVLVDVGDATLEVHTGANRAEHFVAGPEHALEKLKLLRQQFVHTGICLVAAIHEVDHHDVVLLPVAMATPDALFDALRIPRQVVVDDQ